MNSSKSPKKYIRARIKEKKIKITYFLTPLGFLDQFHLMGTVYAQSASNGTSSTGGTGSGTHGTSGGCTGGN